MFRTFIYVDKEKLYSYMRQTGVVSLSEPKSGASKGQVSATIPFANLAGSYEKRIDVEYVKDLGVDFDHFECALAKRLGDDYFDFVMSSNYDINTVPSMSILRFNSPFSIPEKFDIINVTEQLRPILLETLGADIEKKQDKELLEYYLGNASADIPIIMDLEDIRVSANLHTSNLLERYTELEEYEEQNVHVLCKVIGRRTTDTVQIFDPLKDFIHLNRAMRRSKGFNDDNKAFDKISIEGPVLKVEVIAMYK